MQTDEHGLVVRGTADLLLAPRSAHAAHAGISRAANLQRGGLFF